MAGHVYVRSTGEPAEVKEGLIFPRSGWGQRPCARVFLTTGPVRSQGSLSLLLCHHPGKPVTLAAAPVWRSHQEELWEGRRSQRQRETWSPAGQTLRCGGMTSGMEPVPRSRVSEATSSPYLSPAILLWPMAAAGSCVRSLCQENQVPRQGFGCSGP